MSNQKHNISIAYTTRLFSDALESLINNLENYSLTFTSPTGKDLFKNLNNTSSDQVLIL